MGTLLRVALDPIGRLAVVAALLQPHLRDVTHDWSMIALHGATKAEQVLLALEAHASLLALQHIRALPADPTCTARHCGYHRREAGARRC